MTRTNKAKIFVMLCCFFSIFLGQMIYNGTGHIPVAFQEDWSKAGLLSNLFNPNFEIYNVEEMIGTTDDEKVNSALTMALNDGKKSIIYFPNKGSRSYVLKDSIILDVDNMDGE